MKHFIVCALLFITIKAHAGDTTKLYDPTANVRKDVAALLVKAKTNMCCCKLAATGACGATALMPLCKPMGF